MRKPSPVYYSVHALKDGTIVVASPSRKPRRSSGVPKAKIDEDGIFQWRIELDNEKMGRWQNVNPFQTTAMCLNFRRILRSMIGGKIDRLEQKLLAVQEQLGRVENAIASLATVKLPYEAQVSDMHPL